MPKGMPNQSDVSIKSTKAELFSAYEEMRAKAEEAQKGQLPINQQAVIKKEEEKVLEKTAGYVPENLESEINSLKKKIQLNLEGAQEQLIAESGKLSDIRKAIEIETKRLEEIYNIKLAADTLQVLIADLEAKKKELEKQRFEEENILREEISSKKKEWEREQEEYKYNLKLERKKEEDQYNLVQEKKQSEWQAGIDKKEAEISERENEANKKTEEIESIKKQIEEFPKKLESAVNETKEKVQRLMQKDFDTEKRIFDQKSISDKAMFESKIENLQEAIKSQSAEIISLKKSLAESNQRAQDLATTIVENVSGSKQLRMELEKKQKEETKDKGN